MPAKFVKSCSYDNKVDPVISIMIEDNIPAIYQVIQLFLLTCMIQLLLVHIQRILIIVVKRVNFFIGFVVCLDGFVSKCNGCEGIYFLNQ